MEQEVLKILFSGKSLDRYERVLHVPNSEGPGKYEENEGQPQRKRFLGWGRIGIRSIRCDTQELDGAQTC